MKLFPTRALIVSTVAAAITGTMAVTAVSATAQTASPAPVERQATPAHPDAEGKAKARAQRQAERTARLQQQMAERQARFKAELKITPEQEPAWNAFIARTQPTQPAERAAAAQPPAPAREAWAQLSTPERLDRLQARQAERDARTARRHDAIRSFYAALDTEQKKIFDERTARSGGFQRAGMHPRNPHPGFPHMQPRMKDGHPPPAPRS